MRRITISDHVRHGLVLATLLCGAPALAQEKPAEKLADPQALKVELNRIKPEGKDCRVYFLIENPGKVSYNSLKLDLFALDTGGVIAKRLAVDIAPIRPEKTSVKLFDFAGLACDRFGQLLLNSVIACTDKAGSHEGCVNRIETTSRTDVPFVK